MDSNQKKTLVASIVKFLENEIKDNTENDQSVDFVEGLEVATQCIRGSFDLSSIDYDRVPNLAEAFTAGCKSLECCESAVKREVTPEDKAAAEQLKAEGNRYITENKFLEAVDAYSQAIDKDPYNAVYYGNRAAAYSKLSDHGAAITDCERALKNDPTYSKAYGRMGFAYAAQKNHVKAVECYEKALSLEPENASYRQNLETARNALPATAVSSTGGGFGGSFGGGLGGGGGGGAPDLMSLLNNPQMMQMASQMMQSPQVQQMVASMMSGFGGGGGGFGGGVPGATGQSGEHNEQEHPAGPPPNITDLLRMGQQFASQMQAENPELVETLRREHQQQGGGAGGGSNGGSGENKDDANKDQDGSGGGGGGNSSAYS